MRALIIAGVFAAAGTAHAQIPIPIPAQRPGQRSDSTGADTVTVPPFRIYPPISPMGAFGRSLLLPGWGQAVLGRRVTGAAFVFWEGITVTMLWKTVHQLHYLERTGSSNVALKRQEVQDWAVLLAFNHLLAGAEAFVSSSLWDFPVELESSVLPQGRVGIGLRMDLGRF